MENNSSVCKLKISNDLRSKTPPFLVKFSNGAINLNSSRKIQFKSLRPAEDKHSISSAAARRVLVANNGRLNYQSDVSNRNLDQSKMRYYVGVRNKTSGEMKVYDALSFHLRPKLRNDIQPTPSTSEAKSVKDKLIDLTASFGSKDMIRSMNARIKYSTTDVAPLEDLSLNESFPNADHSITMTNSTTSIEYIPPQNRNANTVDEVYRISDIILAEDDRFLTELADKLIDDLPTCLSEWINDNVYCEYVLNHLNGTSGLDDVKVKYLLYYNFLVIFSRLTAADIKKKDPAPEIPNPIKSNLLEFYTVSSENESGKIIRTFSKLMKDKLLSYMLVLALFIDNYSVNLAEVQNGTKYAMSKIVNVAQALGCYISRHKIQNSNVQFAVLKLPLSVQQKYYKKF